MKGQLITIRTSGAVEVENYDASPSLEALKKALGGGFLERVPRFDKWDGQNCVAFCDEHGKQLGKPINYPATQHWCDVVRAIIPDVLVGDVVVVTGDAEFMESL